MVPEIRSLKIIASILLLIAVVMLPITLIGKNIGSIIFLKGQLTSFITDAITLYDDEKEEKALKKTIVAKMIEKFETDMTNQIVTPENRMQNQMKLYGGLMVFGSVQSHEINNIIKGVFSRDVLWGLLSELTDPLSKWLDDDEIYPDISLNIKPLKERVQGILPQIIEIPIGILPNCDGNEVVIIRNFNNASKIEDLPQCAPKYPGPDRVKFVSILTDFAVDKLQNAAPDIIPLNEVINPRDKKKSIPMMFRSACMNCHQHGKYRKDGHKNKWMELKKNALTARSVLNYSWILPIILLLSAGFFMSGLTVEGAKWIYLPLMISGSLTFLFALFFKFGVSIFSAPDPMVEYLASFFFSVVSKPLFVQAMVLFTVGSIIIYIVRKKNQRSNDQSDIGQT